MIKRRTLGLAAATAVLGGLGAYGSVTATAATPTTGPKPTTTQSSAGGDREAMIRHCTDQLPPGDQAKARQQMEQMMSDGMMSGSMTGSTSHGGHHDMG